MLSTLAAVAALALPPVSCDDTVCSAAAQVNARKIPTEAEYARESAALDAKVSEMQAEAKELEAAMDSIREFMQRSINQLHDTDVLLLKIMDRIHEQIKARNESLQQAD